MTLGRDPFARLSLNTMTTRSCSFGEAVAATAAAGLPAIGLWRDKVAEVGLNNAAKLLRDSGLRVSSLCRGGFLTGLHDGSSALDDNRRAIDEAAALGAPELVLVAGGIPDRDLAGARTRLAERLGELVPYAADREVRLTLEPLHPMFCADRAVISTLAQALAPSRHRTPRRRSEWSSTPFTCGGTPNWPRASPPPAPRAGSAAFRSVTGWYQWRQIRWCPAA
jgi:hypothetical protein